MSEPFSRQWCDQVNRHIAEEVAADGSAAARTAVEDDTRVEVLVRLRRPDAGVYRGLATITPRRAPFVVMQPYDSKTASDVEIELPVQLLPRISGKSVAECGSDPWIPAMLRVHKGMDVVMEMFYRHGFSSPIRNGTVPQLT